MDEISLSLAIYVVVHGLQNNFICCLLFFGGGCHCITIDTVILSIFFFFLRYTFYSFFPPFFLFHSFACLGIVALYKIGGFVLNNNNILKKNDRKEVAKAGNRRT